MAPTRNQGIDFLRLTLMFMVCLLHILGQGGVLSACEENTLKHAAFWLPEAFAYCAVDSFALISGYMASKKPVNPVKIVDMWFQVFFYSLILSLVLILCGVNTNFTTKELIQWSFPVTGNVFWYFTAYVPCFFAAPYFTKAICDMSQITAKKAFIILIVLFSGIGILTDPFKTYAGYSAIWIMVLYCIGALANHIHLFEERTNAFLLLIFVLSVLFSWGFFILTGIQRLINYHSPTILLAAMILVLVFFRIPLKSSRITKLAPLSFGIYLFQLNPVIWNTILYDRFSFLATYSLPLGILCVFAFAFLLFCIGLLVEAFRLKVMRMIRLHSLSERIVTSAEYLLEKSAFFLK